MRQMVQCGIKGICARLTLAWMNYLLIAHTQELHWVFYKDLMPIKTSYHSKLPEVLCNNRGVVLQLSSAAHSSEPIVMYFDIKWV